MPRARPSRESASSRQPPDIVREPSRRAGHPPRAAHDGLDQLSYPSRIEAMSTKKVTISLDANELTRMVERAKRLHGGNLSAAFVDGLRALRRREGLKEFLRMSNAPSLSPDQVSEVLAEIRGDGRRPKTRSRRAA